MGASYVAHGIPLAIRFSAVANRILALAWQVADRARLGELGGTAMTC